MICRDTNIQRTLKFRQRGWVVNPYRFGGAGGDPYFGNVLLLLHGEGSNGSTTFTDSSSFNRTVSVGAGSPTISTAQFKYGSASIVGGGHPTRLTSPFTGVPTYHEYTIELWYRRNGSASYRAFYYNGNFAFNLQDAFKLNLNNGGADVLVGNAVITDLTWRHIALTRRLVSTGPNTYRASFWVDGVEDAFITGTSSPTLDPSLGFSIGRNDSAGFSGIGGNIDEYRITAGVARYTAAFTPPTGPFPDF